MEICETLVQTVFNSVLQLEYIYIYIERERERERVMLG